MGFATHLGPWLLGTVKNTTGTTAGTIRNMGATTVAQTYTAPASVILASPTAQQFLTHGFFKYPGSNLKWRCLSKE